MALPSFFKRKNSKPEPAAPLDNALDDAGPVQVARARARRRLIGAVVLLAIGVIGFPMLFETQPRPLPKDIPIELPRREGAAPRPAALPHSTPAVTELPPTTEATAAAPPAPMAPAAASEAVAAAVPAPAPTPAPTPAPADTKVAATKPVPPVAPAPDPKPLPAKPEVARPDDTQKADAERARAMLEGRADPAAKAAPPASSTPDPKAGRFVVQVGAYTDANTLRDVRNKVEKLGLKTYTQSVDTDSGKRTRVRVGPFTTRQEAESASGKLKGAGLPGNVLTL